MKLESAKNRQHNNPVDQELLKKRRQLHAESQSRVRDTEDPELNEHRHNADAEIHRGFRNPEDPELNEQRHNTEATRMVAFRNPEDPELNQECHEIDAARDRERNLPGRLERAAQTPEQTQEKMQRNFEQRTVRLKANKKACNASAIFCGDQIVKEHYIGSFTTNRGGDANRCQHCDALRFLG